MTLDKYTRMVDWDIESRAYFFIGWMLVVVAGVGFVTFHSTEISGGNWGAFFYGFLLLCFLIAGLGMMAGTLSTRKISYIKERRR